MDDPAFAAVHRVESVGLLGLANLIGNGECGDTELFLAQEAEVIGVETNERMLIVVHVEDFLRKLFECEKSLALVGEQVLQIVAEEANDESRLLEVGSGFVAVNQFVFDVEVSSVQDGVEEIGEVVSDGVDVVHAIGHEAFTVLTGGLFLFLGRGFGRGGSRLWPHFVEEVLLNDTDHVASEPV